MNGRYYQYSIVLLAFLLLTGCNYNPFIANNHTTGNPAGAIAGAAVGAGGIALAGGSRPLIIAGGVGGGALGYYVTTLTYDAGGITRAGGEVYQVGEYIGIYLPTDKIFEPNTADFLPQSRPLLESTAAVLRRYPQRNVILSGNTTGFYRSKWEQRLSQQRAKKVAEYLWNAGVNQAEELGSHKRSLTYVGYGSYFPIAHKYTNSSLRKNARIQITVYPADSDLRMAGSEPFKTFASAPPIYTPAKCTTGSC